ncbi:hypothetical protein [Methylobacterium sp. ID0610]|uniref:hypothetical protein n=1 Tax=Methylobacterium carpenticola TaxID=3344827 RepID=UPI00368EA209
MRLRLGLALLLATGAAAGAQQAPVACGERAAEYASAKGVALWVTRRGTLTRENPLRPLTPDNLQVLQVVIRNKAATAYGPDLDTLRRGLSPAGLEAQSGAAIKWTEGVDGLPPTLRILEDDGAGVLAALQFRGCGEAPKVAAVKPAPAARRDAAAKAKPDKAKTDKARTDKASDQPAAPTRLPNGFTLPQGAIE